jgi:hypothetical protein
MPQAKQGVKIKRHIHSHLIFIGLIAILPLVLFWRWIFKGEVLFWGTSMYQFWPWRHLAKTLALSGEWPLWNPLLGNGTPLLANLQTAFFYPANMLYFLVPVEHGLTLSVILHLILAGLFMFAYTRAIGLTPFAATISALGYMFSGYVIGRAQFVTMVNAFAWFPLLLLLAERMVTRRLYRHVLWLGLALAGQFLAGHAQLWFYGLWLIGAYVLFRSWAETRQWTEILAGLLRYGLAVGLSVMVAAMQILPTAEFILQSSRHSGAEQYFALTYSFWPWRLVTLLAPNFFGNPAHNNYWGYANYWEDHAYIGVLPLLLVLTAIWPLRPHFKRHRTPSAAPKLYQRVAPFFIALVPISLILAMGWYTPVYLWLFEFGPGFSFFQAPARLLIWYTLAVTILAGIGAQTFTLTPHNQPGWRRLLIATVGFTLAGIAGRLVLSGRSLTFVNATITTGILLIIAISLLLIYPNGTATPHRKHFWQGAMLAFVAIDLLWFAYPLIPMLPGAVYTSPITAADVVQAQPAGGRLMVDDDADYNLKFQTFFRFDTFGPIELDYWQDFKNTLVPNVGIYANLPAANNDDPLVVERWQAITDLVGAANPAQKEKLLALMNVTFFIDDPTHAIWPEIYHNEMITIQQLPHPLPRAYFVNWATGVDTAAEARKKLTSPQFDPHHEVIIMKTGRNLAFPNQTPVKAGSVPVTIVKDSPRQIILTVDAPTAGYVILADTHYPGWQATVDGQPAVIWPANLAFRAVAVEAGRHQIEYVYHPRSFALGLGVSIISLLILLGIAIGTALKQRRGQKPDLSEPDTIHQ